VETRVGKSLSVHRENSGLALEVRHHYRLVLSHDLAQQVYPEWNLDCTSRHYTMVVTALEHQVVTPA
jgi:hypothetical protein